MSEIVQEAVVVLGRPGNDLLSRVLRHSTIGAEEFNGRVRDGIGFRLLAQITGPAKDNNRQAFGFRSGAIQRRRPFGLANSHEFDLGVSFLSHGHGP